MLLLIDVCLSYALALWDPFGHFQNVQQMDQFNVSIFGLEDTINLNNINNFLQWTPPNVTVPILNLVDNVFQLKKRGWLRYCNLFGLPIFPR